MVDELTNWTGSRGGPVVRVGRDTASLAKALADRFVETLAFRLKDEWVSIAHVVLCGGGVAEEMISVVEESPRRPVVDWSKVHVWWSDERFLETGHIGRHETRARSAGLLRLGVHEDHVHAVPPALHERDAKVERAADEYTTLLRKYAPYGRLVPVFDLVLLEVGEAGEVGAIYPGSKAQSAQAPVMPITNAPRAPAERVTMTYAAINPAARVWLLASGSGCAEAVGQAVTGAPAAQIPAVGATGVLETIRWLDEAAARCVPPPVRGIAVAPASPTSSPS